jgi:hypothetical protein
MIERGELRAAGAILGDAGDMIGSVVFAEFPAYDLRFQGARGIRRTRQR